jgi:hypothetical protein
MPDIKVYPSLLTKWWIQNTKGRWKMYRKKKSLSWGSDLIVFLVISAGMFHLLPRLAHLAGYLTHQVHRTPR